MLIMLALPCPLGLTTGSSTIHRSPTIFNELRAAVGKLEELVLQIHLCLTQLLFASPLSPITTRHSTVATFGCLSTSISCPRPGGLESGLGRPEVPADRCRAHRSLQRLTLDVNHGRHLNLT
jgi:hypothetical protein